MFQHDNLQVAPALRSCSHRTQEKVVARRGDAAREGGGGSSPRELKEVSTEDAGSHR